MARPSNPAYVLGRVTTVPHPTKEGWTQARGYYRNASGKRVEVTAGAKTGKGKEPDGAAVRALQVKVRSAEAEHQGGDRALNQGTALTRAAEIWYDTKEREQLAANTMRDYRGYIDRTVKQGSLSHLTVSEANDVSRIETWLAEVADERGETAAKQARKVISGILRLAERRGAIAASVVNRVETPGAKPGSVGDRKCRDVECDYECGKRHLDTRRAFTPAEVTAVMDAARASHADVADVAAFLFGTGVRISEALHCVSWADVDLDAGTVRVRGTKTANADRVLTLADDLTERLRQRAALYGTKGLVFGITRFPAKAGQARDRNNVSKSLRLVFAKAGVPWAGTHTFRRTVATWLDASGSPLAEIANQLGHADINITANYLGRTGTPTRAASVMVLPTSPSELKSV